MDMQIRIEDMRNEIGIIMSYPGIIPVHNEKDDQNDGAAAYQRE
jgi:hypothetical protein